MAEEKVDYQNFKASYDMSAEGIIKLYETEKSERGPLEAHWRDLAKLSFPRKSNILSVRSPEQKVDNEEVYDDTAIQSNITLSNGLQTNLTPPNVKWFNLRAKKAILNDDDEVKEYFSVAGEQVFKTLSESNFSEQIHEDYQDLGGFGNSCIFVEEDPNDDVRFYTLSVPNAVYYWEDSKKRVNKVIRLIEFTTMQAVDEFGADAGKTVLDAFKEKKFEDKHLYLHCVGERYERNPGKKDSKNKPYYSFYVSIKDRKIVREGGYDEFPFFFGRFYKNDSSKYGYSPNMLCFPSIKSVNQLAADSLQASRIAVRPPLEVPYKGYHGEININPGKLNYKRQGADAGDSLKPILTGVNPQANEPMILRLQNSIKQAYFVNMFLALEEKTNMTATEVAERINEKMSQLGPALKRLENEKLRGIIHRVFMILLRNKKISEPPNVLQEQGGEYDISYTSRLELAQKMSEIQSVDQFVLRVTNLAAVDPSALDNLNADEVVKNYESAYNVPPLLTRRPEEVAQIRDKRAEQQQQQALLQSILAGSQGAKNVAGAEKETAQAKAAENVAA